MKYRLVIEYGHFLTQFSFLRLILKWLKWFAFQSAYGARKVTPRSIFTWMCALAVVHLKIYKPCCKMFNIKPLLNIAIVRSVVVWVRCRLWLIRPALDKPALRSQISQLNIPLIETIPFAFSMFDIRMTNLSPCKILCTNDIPSMVSPLCRSFPEA